MSENQIEFLRAERQKHIDELSAIDRRVNEIINRYKQAVDIELNAIENIDNIFSENDIPIVPEEDNEEEIADSNENENSIEENQYQYTGNE